MLLYLYGLGYIYAYVHGLVKAIDMQVTTHSYILLMNSHTLTRTLRSPDIAQLIEATEANGDSLATFLVSTKPVIENSETRRQVDIALTAWDQAKEKLQELRALQSKTTEDNP